LGSPNRNPSQKEPRFSSFQTYPDLHYNGGSWTFLPPLVAMSSSRPNLTLDERSFQGLLSAAFIIQEHNDRQKEARPAPAESEGERVGQQGGAAQPANGSRSESSSLDELRPGERLQRNWAAMWLKSQEQGLWPERSAEIREAPQEDAPQNNRITEVEDDAEDFAAEGFASSKSDDDLPIEASLDESIEANLDALTPVSFLQRLADLRVKLRFRRADLYLGTSILVAALALLWPTASLPQRAALSPFERALVALGIAEAPAPVIHLQGDPGIEVWVDPHSALYYCPGEEQYGKTSGGRLSSQHDAQMDRFEPAGRSACE